MRCGDWERLLDKSEQREDHSLMINYEEPTNEFRQVKIPIKRGNGILGPGYYETIIGYDITIQQKWRVRSVPIPVGMPFGLPSWVEEWRDLPTVSSKDTP